MTESTSFSVRYIVTADNAIAAAALVRPPTYRLNTVIAVLVLVGGLVVIAEGDPVFGTADAFFAAAFLALFRTTPGQRWWAGRQARGVLGRIQRMTFTESGVEFDSLLSTGEIPWSAITEIRRDDRSIVFVYRGLFRGYIPVDAFASAVDREQVVSFASARIAAAAAAKRK